MPPPDAPPTPTSPARAGSGGRTPGRAAPGDGASASLPAGALAGALLDASDRLNEQLMRRLEARGWPALTRHRSLLFRHLLAGLDRPASLARALDITRQSIQKLLEGLEADGLVTRGPDPEDARAQRVAVTPRGRRMVRDAEAILADLEDELARQVGQERIDSLRTVVALLLRDATVAPIGSRPPEPGR
jgi:DNA-binding MarR family transcriptional regulator